MMNSSFSQVTDVIEYKSLYRIDGKRELLLWPVWAYRVVAPKIVNQNINVLQKVVLGMSRVGETRIKKMDDKLNLGSDLIAHVFNELIMKGLIENDGTLTERAKDYYKSDLLEDAEQIVGYVFQDPWSGSLWHRFKEDPFNNLIEIQENNNSSGLILKLGTTGSPKMIPAFRVFPPYECVPTTPDSREILFALQKFKKLLKNKESTVEQNNIEPTRDLYDEVYSISKISLIDEEPVPLYLVTAIHLNQKNSQSKTWFATDPFGLGENYDMRKRIKEKLPEIPSLKDKINRFTGKEIIAGIDNYEQFMKNINEKAVISLEKMFSREMYNCPGLFSSLISLKSRYDEYKIRRIHSKRLMKDIIRDAAEPIEAIFSYILECYPISIDDVENTITIDREHNRSIFNNISESFGFKTPLPSGLVTDKNKLIGVILYDTTTLGPLVLLNILSARHLPNHPLKMVGQIAPDLFEKISYVKLNRDPQSHFAKNGEDEFDVDNQVKSTFYIIEILLKQLEINNKGKYGKRKK
jgi:hypothetical protein